MPPNERDIAHEYGRLTAAADGERCDVMGGEGPQRAVQRPSRPADSNSQFATSEHRTSSNDAWVKSGKGGMRLEDDDGNVLYGPTWTPSQMVDWAHEHGLRLHLPEVERG